MEGQHYHGSNTQDTSLSPTSPCPPPPPTLSQRLPGYLRAKTDTLHHQRVTREHENSAAHKEEADVNESSGTATHHGNTSTDSSEGFPRRNSDNPFCTTYEVSFTPPNMNQHPNSAVKGSPNANLSASHIPSNINPASLREKRKYFNFSSRDAPPPTAPSQYIVDFQQHMRNVSKAEVSRNVRKTEPPNLARIFRGPNGEEDPEQISMRSLNRRKLQKMKEEDDERDRHRSLLYHKDDYHARHGTTAPILSNSPYRRRREEGGYSDSNKIGESFSNCTDVSQQKDVVRPQTAAGFSMGKSKINPAATTNVRKVQSASLRNQVQKSKIGSGDAPCGPSPTDASPPILFSPSLFQNSPLRYRTAFFNQNQFERYAPEGWDRVARLSPLRERKRALSLERGREGIHTSREGLEYSSTNNNNNKNGNIYRGGLVPAGLSSDHMEANRRQFISGIGERPRRELPAQHTADEIRELQAAQQPAAAIGSRRATTSANDFAAKVTRRTLPKAIRDQINAERTPNDVVMQFIVDPVLRMELVEKQRNWRTEYVRLKEEYAQEVDKKESVLREIETLQREKRKVDRSASSVYLH